MIARSYVAYSLLVGYSGGKLLELQAWNLREVDEWLKRDLPVLSWGRWGPSMGP